MSFPSPENTLQALACGPPTAALSHCSSKPSASPGSVNRSLFLLRGFCAGCPFALGHFMLWVFSGLSLSLGS